MSINEDEIDVNKSIEQVFKEHDLIMQEYMKLFKPREHNNIRQSTQLFSNSIINIEGSTTIPLEHKPKSLQGKYSYEYRGKRIKNRVRIKW